MKSQTTHSKRRLYSAAASIPFALVALTGCSASATEAPPGSCPDTPLVSTVFIDVTGSHYSAQIGSEYEDAIADIVLRTATCSGSISVATFGETSGRTEPLLDQSFQVDAPTDNALHRKQQKLVESAVATVHESLADAAAKTPASATDILGLLRLVDETQVQRPESTHEVVILTDGFTNVGVDPALATNTKAAIALAEQVSVPDLTGVSLRFAGVGRTTTPVASEVIEQITAFWSQICDRTGATLCTVATKWQG